LTDLRAKLLRVCRAFQDRRAEHSECSPTFDLRITQHSNHQRAEHGRVREALAAHGLLRESQVADLRGGRGHRSVADGLVGLAHLFRDNWDAVSAKSAVTVEHLARADELGVQLLEAIGGRALARKRDKSDDAGLRALTLLVQVYEQVRGAVVYVRWNEKDADEIAPSLYGGRARRRLASEEEITPPAEEAPAVNPTAPPSPAPPVA
jgi:hypothetical protein